MRLVVWNILHGGGPRRIPEIAMALLEQAPDLVTLCEFRTTRGGQLRAVLADHGLGHQLVSDVPATRNGVLIASRWPLAPGDPAPAGVRPGRWLATAVNAPASAFDLLSVHVPDDSDPSAKAAQWQALVRWARTRNHAPAVIAGDFNTGRHRVDESGATFGCTEHLGTLVTLGFADAWRSRNPPTFGTGEITWKSSVSGGFRIDAAFLSPPLMGRLTGVKHAHGPRETGVSDHSLLVVDWE